MGWAQSVSVLPRAKAEVSTRGSWTVDPSPPKTLRVLVLNERCHRHPSAGGVEVSLFARYSRLADQGISIELLCAGFAGAAAHEVHRGVHISRVGSGLSYYARVPSEVRRRIRAGQVDVVVEELSKVPFLSPLYAEVPVVAVHYHFHGLTAFRQVRPWIAAGAVALESLIPLVYRRVPILTISKSSKNDLIRRGLPEEHIDVVHCGLDHEGLRPASIEGRRPLIVSLGRLEPYKRVDLLLRAMPHVLKQVPSARLVILGRGQDEARLRRLTVELGLAESVTFAGFVTDAEREAWLQSAALHVQCSSKEGWGLTVTEAYACGTPVVATDAPGLCDSVQDGVTGVLVRRASPEPLAAAIANVLSDENERCRLARNALAWSANFRWEPFAEAMRRTLRVASQQVSEPAARDIPKEWKSAEVAA